ncbi:hypothetical protein, partial [Lacrimispora sp.]|uniref:hypothetical protein n=1 Tax=Lacrimispora sp. TaxID=2719234 RepID=UPI0034603381
RNTFNNLIHCYLCNAVLVHAWGKCMNLRFRISFSENKVHGQLKIKEYKKLSVRKRQTYAKESYFNMGTDIKV